MAHALTNTAVSDFGLINRARAAISNYLTYLHTLSELRSLTNRELADLGLSRVVLRDVARESVYGF